VEASSGSATIRLGRRPPVEAAAGQTVLEALAALEIKLSQPVIAVVNGQTADLNYRLQPGDQVRLIPQIGGGALPWPPGTIAF
jgi:sulfur carrier protein ThiS